MNTGVHRKHLTRVLLFQIVAIHILPYLTHYTRTTEEMTTIRYGQWNFMIAMTWNMADFLTVNESGLELLDTRIPESRNYNEKDIETSSDSDAEDTLEPLRELSCTACKICFREYSADSKKRIPLMLSSCGHTVCWKCAGKLLKQNYNSFICCPLCRKITYTGSVHQLPRNYAIIDVIQMKNRETTGTH
ncbi:hypothetical protein CAEBREN_07847 [Caenorhabditis brenneri]|uniref:RING-type domain-containing protein n=1 Tax=Caenorhabditis brenneri TaxID=135651 RepID=G0MTW0_CAEBE|nr:hypothetical protein CAEBREN_07847 [Caenorhabditis brenneri]